MIVKSFKTEEVNIPVIPSLREAEAGGSKFQTICATKWDSVSKEQTQTNNQKTQQNIQNHYLCPLACVFPGTKETLNSWLLMNIITESLWKGFCKSLFHTFGKISCLKYRRITIEQCLKRRKQGGRDRRITVQGQPGQKLERPYFKSNSGVLMHSCCPSYSGGRNKKITLEESPRQKCKILSEKHT
jgi:hypothetical protein